MILTLDVERDWERGGTKNLELLPKIFDLLEDHDSRATLFIVSSIAGEVSEIGVPKKFEIASHGKTHIRLDRAEREKVREEIVESKRELEELFKRKVTGFRAPYFVLPKNSYGILKEAGYIYSSSRAFGIFPGRYVNFSTRPEKIGGVWEFPVSGFLIFNFGLSWIRLFWPFSRFFLPSAPQVFYFHPTELLEEAPKLGLIGKFYGRNRGKKAWEILEEIMARYGPTESFAYYLRTYSRSSGFER